MGMSQRLVWTVSSPHGVEAGVIWTGAAHLMFLRRISRYFLLASCWKRATVSRAGRQYRSSSGKNVALP